MADNETIKALEEYLQKCQNIKYGARKKILVDADFLKDVLNFANRQNAEIEKLEKRLKGQKHALFEQQSYTAKLQVENEENSLKIETQANTIKILENALENKQAEIERLMPFSVQVEVSKKIEKEIKSEAIKKFWDKAKEKGTTAYYDYRQRPCVWVEDGDNLVKEMVGE